MSGAPTLRPSWALVIVVGGALGTAARYAAESALPAEAGSWPWMTWLINVVGSVALGALLEGLAGLGHETERRRLLRLGLGTGVLGGFTTYSSFAVETAQLFGSWAPWLGLGYAVTSVVVGVLAAVAGMRGVRALAARGVAR